jgi:hypothetical protein
MSDRLFDYAQGFDMLLRGFCSLAAAILLAALVATSASAQTDLLQDSTFSTSGGTQITSGFQLGYNGTLDGWSNSNAGGNGGGSGGIYGYNFLFIGSGGAQSVNGVSGALSLWNASNGGLTTWTGTGPTVNGSTLNYIAADGVYETGAISQMVTGLVAGQQYKLQFFYAGAQQYSFTGLTTEGWKVGLGDTLSGSLSTVSGASPTYQTTILNNANHSFTGWVQASFTFTADAANEYLTFLAVGTPNGEPPFTLLADPTIIVPEPGSACLLAAAALGMVYLRRKRAA